MEAEDIVISIISQTKQKLLDTGISLNMLDILQTYDAFIKKQKLSIDLKTRVYKTLLKWSREHLHDSSTNESIVSSPEEQPSLRRTNSDLEYDFREANTEGRDRGHRKFEFEEVKDDNDIVIKQYHKKMTLPKLCLDNVLLSKTAQSVIHTSEYRNIEKPPIAKKVKHSFVNASTEKPFKDSEVHRRGKRHRGSTVDNLDQEGGRRTPNFRSSEKKYEMSPEDANSFEKVEKRSNSNSSNTRESQMGKRVKSSEPRAYHRFSDLMHSQDSEFYGDMQIGRKFKFDARQQIA
jgi:hypothetical protein